MTAPMFVAAGTPRGGVGAVAMPAGVLAGDVLLLSIETGAEAYGTPPSGWEEAANSPQVATGTRLTVFWKRAAAGEGAVTVAGTFDHIYSVVTAYRGCPPAGNPWNVTSGGTDSTSDTDVSIGGGTTTLDKCMVVVICTSSADQSAPWASGWTNGDVTLTERTDDATSSGNGGGVAIATGVKTTAGAYGATDVTLTGAATKAYMTIALQPSSSPWVKRVGAGSGSDTGFTPVWPAHDSGDVGLLFVETANQAVTAPSGWAEVPNSPQGTGTAGGTAATMMQVFWKRATSSSETNPAIADAGDHQIGVIVTFGGVVTSGNPWNVTTGSVKASASTDVSVAGTDTTSDNTLAVVAVATGPDVASTTEFSAWANALLTGFAEYVDYVATPGNGGGFGIAAGALPALGSIGTTTATLVNSFTNGHVVVALQPEGTTLTPGPVAVVLAVPEPMFGFDVVLTPAPVAAVLVVPVPDIGGVSDVQLTPAPVAIVLTVPVPTWDWIIVLEPAPVAITLAIPEPAVFTGWSQLRQPFYLGSVYAELSQPFVVIGPVVTARLDQWFDLAGSMGSGLSQPFTMEGAVGATLHELFDLLGVPGYIPTASPVWLPLMVFDKAGAYLGSIGDFNVTGPPVRYLRSMRVTNEGGMTFNARDGGLGVGVVGERDEPEAA